MPEPKIRDRLVGGWRLTGFEVTPGGQTEQPLGDGPPGTILNTPDGYMSAQLDGPGPYADEDQPDVYYIAYSGPCDVDETSQSVAHHLQVSLIPSWQGTRQLWQVHVHGPDTLTLPVSEPAAGGMATTTTVNWVTPAATVIRSTPCRPLSPC